MAIGLVKMDDPANRGWLQRLGLSSFPVGKLYGYGEPLGTYLSGPTAPEIVRELKRRAEVLARSQRAASAAPASGRTRSWLPGRGG